jgi:ceramide glucosyltransferase
MSRGEGLLFALALAAAAMSLGYLAICVWAGLLWRGRGSKPATQSTCPAVTILKPLCGAEPGLAENLRSFCDQTYPTFQILFGARESDDPALEVAREVAAAFPDRDITVLAGSQPLGENRKVNTLAHLIQYARYDVLVVADSDISVGPDYLREVVAPLSDPSIGIVTCLYRAASTGSLWSRLVALGIEEWFLPAVLVSRAFGSSVYCSGSTIALRRTVLEATGGFETLAGFLADDFELGRRIRQLGLRSVLSRHEVTTTVHEPDFRALFTHELRWMRTIRAVQPLGHAFLFMSNALPMTLLAACFGGRHPWALLLFPLALALRVALHYTLPRAPAANSQWAAWAIPLRDFLSFGVWIASFSNRSVIWRNQTMAVRPDGILYRSETPRPA